MTELALVLAIPFAAALLLAVIGHKAWAAEINIGASLLTLLAAGALALRVARAGTLLMLAEQFLVDPLNVFLIALTALVGFTTSVFSRGYVRAERGHGRLSAGRLRLYHGMFQMFMFTMFLALSTNNLGILWVAMEAATLATLPLVAIYRTPESLEAAWKYFILCGVGIAQALFGAILIYFAAEQVLGHEPGAMLWTRLYAFRGQLEPTVLSLAFVFTIIGYGAKTGLAPLHAWLPDAHAESPAPVSAVLSGLLLNVALYAILRCKALVDGALGTPFAGKLMMGFGLLSVVVAAFCLSRQKDVKRLFGYSSIEHMGLMTFAFGMGGHVAAFAGLLHMCAHSLAKSAVFFAVGRAAQLAGTQIMDGIKGLTRSAPAVGWALMLAALAILGMPPLGLFASEFMILAAAVKEHAWAAPILFIALGVAFAAMFARVQAMAFGDPEAETPGENAGAAAMTPVYLHLALALMLGLWVPFHLAEWFRQAARVIG